MRVVRALSYATAAAGTCGGFPPYTWTARFPRSPARDPSAGIIIRASRSGGINGNYQDGNNPLLVASATCTGSNSFATFSSALSATNGDSSGSSDIPRTNIEDQRSLLRTRGGSSSNGTSSIGGIEKRTKFCAQVTRFFKKRFFLLGAVLAVSAAKLNPAIGATGGLLRPELTVNKGAISLVFFLVGLAIKLGDLAGAALNIRLNLLTQSFSLGAMPAAGWALARMLQAGGIHPALADGVMILMTLPTTVNMCVILTQSAEGNTAAAAFNAVLGNLLGVVVTPALLLLLVGKRLDMAPSLLATFKKLGVKVILPLGLGQLARFTPLRKLQDQQPKLTSRLSECILLTVIYTTFCDTFLSGPSVASATAGVTGSGGGGGVLVLLGILPFVHLLSVGCLDVLSRIPFLKLTERDRIAVIFCGSHKTLAFGIPLIKALFEGHASVGMLAIPLLLYHPTELVVGSALAPMLRSRAEAREAAINQK